MAQARRAKGDGDGLQVWQIPEIPRTEEQRLINLLKGDFWRRVQLLDVFLSRSTDFYGDASKPAQRRPLSLRRRVQVMLGPTHLPVVIYRLSAAAYRSRIPFLPRVLKDLNVALYGVEIGYECVIGPGLFIGHPVGILLGGVRFGRNVSLLGRNSVGMSGIRDTTRDGAPTAGNDVWFLNNSSAFGPITIGDASRVGAFCCLLQSVPPGSVVVAPQPEVRTPRRRGSAPAQPQEPA